MSKTGSLQLFVVGRHDRKSGHGNGTEVLEQKSAGCHDFHVSFGTPFWTWNDC